MTSKVDYVDMKQAVYLIGISGNRIIYESSAVPEDRNF